MTPEEKRQFDEMKRELDRLKRFISVRSDVVQINGLLSVKGDIEFKGVRMLVGDGNPHGNILAPEGSIYLRTGGASGSSFYTNYGGSTGWNNY